MSYANPMMQGVLGANIAAGGPIAATTAQYAMSPFVADPSVAAIDGTEYVYGARPIENAGAASPNFRMARLFSASSEIVLSMAPGSADGPSSLGGADAPPPAGSGSDGNGKPPSELELKNFAYTQRKVPGFDSLPKEIADSLVERFGEKLLERGRPYANYGGWRTHESSDDQKSLMDAAREIAYEYRGRFDFDAEYFAFADSWFGHWEAETVAETIADEGGGFFVIAGEASHHITKQAWAMVPKQLFNIAPHALGDGRNLIFNGSEFIYFTFDREGPTSYSEIRANEILNEGAIQKEGETQIDATMREIHKPLVEAVSDIFASQEERSLGLERVRELIDDGPVVIIIPAFEVISIESPEIVQELIEMACDSRFKERLVVMASSDDPDVKLEGAKTIPAHGVMVRGNVNEEMGWTYGRNLSEHYDALEERLGGFKSLSHEMRMEVLDMFTLAFDKKNAGRGRSGGPDGQLVQWLAVNAAIEEVVGEINEKYGEKADIWTDHGQYSDHFKMSRKIMWRIASEGKRGVYAIAGKHGSDVEFDINGTDLYEGVIVEQDRGIMYTDGTLMDVHDDYEIRDIRRLAKERRLFITLRDDQLDIVPEGEMRTIGESLLEIANDPELGRNLLLVVCSNDPSFRLEGATTIDSETGDPID